MNMSKYGQPDLNGPNQQSSVKGGFPRPPVQTQPDIFKDQTQNNKPFPNQKSGNKK